MAHFVFQSRVVCGTTGFDFRREGNSAVRLEAGLDFGTTLTRGYTTGLFSTVPQKARHCFRMMFSLQELIWTGLQHATSLSPTNELTDALEHVLTLFGVVTDFSLVVRQRDVQRLIDAVDIVDSQPFELFRGEILFNILPVF